MLGRIPLRPHQLTAPVTPTADTIVLCHMGVARLEAATWDLAIDGLVERPAVLTLADLRRLPAHRIKSVHQCAGSPLKPREPTRRVANVVWSGVRLADVLGVCGVRPEARYVWSEGADWGAFAGVDCPAYRKDLPLERALSPDVLLAFELNGAPLPPEHGFPVRLVVPGYFGTNSVKWLRRLTLAPKRAEGLFVSQLYNDPVLDAAGHDTGATVPVWSLHPEAVIVAPAPATRLAAGTPVEVWGWAWGDRAIARVDVSTDGGSSWQAARLTERLACATVS